MKKYLSYTLLFVLFVLTIGLSATSDGAKAASPAATVSSILDDQTGVAVTIYNANLGLVKDQRQIKLPMGREELRFMDVASKIMPPSVRIRSLIDPASLSILEQNYEYDLVDRQKLLEKYKRRSHSSTKT